MTSNPKGIVLFDFDGTVVDTMTIYADWVSTTLNNYFNLDRDFVRKKYFETAGRPFIDQLSLLGITHASANKISREFTEFKKEILKKIDLDECVKGLLNELRERGIITVLSTNNECDSIKESPSILSFHLVLCFDGKRHRKGAEHLNTVLTIFGNIEKILFIGDTDYDINTYQEIGITSIKTRGLFECEESKRILRVIDDVFK